MSFPPKIKAASQIVSVENGAIVFGERTSYSNLNREINGVVATYPNPVQQAIFIAGAEPEAFFDITTSYIYISKN